MSSTTNSKTWQEKEIEDLLKIVRGAEKLKDLSERLEDFNPKKNEFYKDKGII
tara:strand:+ start:438 stop:596 length:159 start_codon:yes stop_codon:yes gene_type:complete